MNSQLLDLVSRLYATVQASDEWSSALAAFVEHFEAEHSVLVVAGGAESLDRRRQIVVGVDPRAFTGIAAQNAVEFREPYNAHESFLGRVVSSADMMTDQEVLRSATYNEVIRPIGGFYALLLTQNEADASFHLALCRGRSAGAFPRADIDRLQLLVPHLTSSIALHRRLADIEARAGDLTRVIDRLSDGVVLTDEFSRPTFLNSRAAQILEDKDGLSLESGRLAGATAQLTQGLRKTIAGVAAPAYNGTGTRDMVVPRPSGRLPLLLQFVPVWRLGASYGGMPPAKAAVFLTEADASEPINREALIDMFRLTPREVDVADLLARGTKPEAIAEKLGIGKHTVRQHLNRAFEKTGARHQAGLVALIRSLDRA